MGPTRVPDLGPGFRFPAVLDSLCPPPWLFLDLTLCPSAEWQPGSRRQEPPGHGRAPRAPRLAGAVLGLRIAAGPRASEEADSVSTGFGPRDGWQRCGVRGALGTLLEALTNTGSDFGLGPSVTPEVLEAAGPDRQSKRVTLNLTPGSESMHGDQGVSLRGGV